MFGDVAFDAAADYGDWEPVREQLGALASLIAAGKASARGAGKRMSPTALTGRSLPRCQVRHLGLSNETPWGLMRFLFEADTSGGALPRVVALQNAYSLTCRQFEVCCPPPHVVVSSHLRLDISGLAGLPGGVLPPRARQSAGVQPVGHGVWAPFPPDHTAPLTHPYPCVRRAC